MTIFESSVIINYAGEADGIYCHILYDVNEWESPSLAVA
jgi:hypothetical protein